MAGCSFDRIFYFTVGSQYSYRQLQAWECLCRSEIPCSLVDSMSLFTMSGQLCSPDGCIDKRDALDELWNPRPYFNQQLM